MFRKEWEDSMIIFGKKKMVLVMVLSMAFLLVVGMSSYVNALSQNQATFSISNQKIDGQNTTFDVTLWVASESVFSGAEFGLNVSEQLKIVRIVYPESNKANKVPLLVKNGINYFGFFGTNNVFSGKQGAVTITLVYTGNEPGYIKWSEASVMNIQDAQQVKKSALELVGEVKVTRTDSDVITGATPTVIVSPSTGESTSTIESPSIIVEDEVLPLGPVVFNFSDINKSWAKNYIQFLASNGIVNGISSTQFMPDSFISRGDFIKLLVNVIGVEPMEGKKFIDVSSKDYYYQSILTAQKIGIISGDKNMFYPKKMLTREDMMVIVVRALQYKKITLTQKAELNQFSDQGKIASYARENVALLVGNKIVNGYNGQLNPKSGLTRAEASKVLYTVYDLMNN